MERNPWALLKFSAFKGAGSFYHLVSLSKVALLFLSKFHHNINFILSSHKIKPMRKRWGIEKIKWFSDKQSSLRQYRATNCREFHLQRLRTRHRLCLGEGRGRHGLSGRAGCWPFIPLSPELQSFLFYILSLLERFH